MRLLASQCVFFDAKGRGIISREREGERGRVCACIMQRYVLQGFVCIIVCKFQQHIVAAGVIGIIEEGWLVNF